MLLKSLFSFMREDATRYWKAAKEVGKKLWSSLTKPCSAPLKSSHLGCLLRTILDWAPIPEGAMGPFLVVPVDPVPNDPPRLLKRLEPVLPDTLVFQASKEPLNQPILLGRIGRDELLLQPIVSTGRAKPATLENQPVIAA